MALKSWILVAVALLSISLGAAQVQEQPAERTCSNREDFDWNNYLQSRLQDDEPDTDCSCVKYFECSATPIDHAGGGHKPDGGEFHGGENIIDVRVTGECSHYLETCCPPNQIIVQSETGGGGIGGGTGGGIGGGTGGGIGGGTGGGIGGGTGGGIGGGTAGGIGGGTGGGIGGGTDGGIGGGTEGGIGGGTEGGEEGGTELGIDGGTDGGIDGGTEGGIDGGIDGGTGGGIGGGDREPEETGNKYGCGHRNPDGIGFCIVGEQNGEAEYGEFPWMVAITAKKNNLFMYQCGGSLINHGVVLTSAHCVANLLPGDLVVRAGEWDTQTENEQYVYQDRDVKSFVMHEKYYAAALYNDVALLFLKEPVTDAPNIGIVCLPEQGAVFGKNERCFVSGWGKDVYGKNGTLQVILKKRDLPVVPNIDCQKALRKTRLGPKFKLDDSFMCAGGEAGIDVCTGDGGSPLVCPIHSASGELYYQQAGIVAWGIGCGEHQTPGVYVDVARFRHWIDQKMANNFVDVASYIKH